MSENNGPTEEPELDLWDERMFANAEKREAAYRSYLQSVEWAKEYLDGALLRLTQQRERLTSMREDRVVLVRNTQGAEVTVYHSLEHPCGRVTGKSRGLSSFDKMLEGEALARSRRMQRCTACGWPQRVERLA